jgi:DNA-directed RNA polymerase alpha subunit
MKVKTDKMEAIRNEAVKDLIQSLLPLGKERLMELEQRLLYEVIIENKSYEELKALLLLPVSRQKVVFQLAVKRMMKVIAKVSEADLDYGRLEKELQSTRKQLAAMEKKLSRRTELSSEQRKILSMPIDKVGFSARIVNSVRGANIRTVSDLIGLSRYDLLKFRNLGKKGVDELDAFLISKGLTWGMEV